MAGDNMKTIYFKMFSINFVNKVFYFTLKNLKILRGMTGSLENIPRNFFDYQMCIFL